MSDIQWAKCEDDHVCCGGATCPGHFRPTDTCGDAAPIGLAPPLPGSWKFLDGTLLPVVCAAMKDVLVASVEDECPTCGAYVLNHALHRDWHADISRRADSYSPPPTYATAQTAGSPPGMTMHQAAPFPIILGRLVDRLAYRPGWTFVLADIDRGQASKGLTLDITTSGYNSYHPGQGQNYRVHHYMPVPPAAYDERSWRRWLFEQLLLVERHEACEFFQINGERSYAPHHGPGDDPYIVFEHGSDDDVRTSFRGEMNP